MCGNSYKFLFFFRVIEHEKNELIILLVQRSGGNVKDNYGTNDANNSRAICTKNTH